MSGSVPNMYRMWTGSWPDINRMLSGLMQDNKRMDSINNGLASGQIVRNWWIQNECRISTGYATMADRTSTGQGTKSGGGINRAALVSVLIPCLTPVRVTMQCRERLALQYRAALLQAQQHLQHAQLDREGKKLGNTLTHWVNSPAGSVPWQERIIWSD